MPKIKIKIICYAGVQKYFGRELTVEISENSNYKNVLEKLIAINTKAKDVLASCRIAVNQEFVSLNDNISKSANINIIPPSSGG